MIPCPSSSQESGGGMKKAEEGLAAISKSFFIEPLSVHHINYGLSVCASRYIHQNTSV
jgi:hypothetical protein